MTDLIPPNTWIDAPACGTPDWVIQPPPPANEFLLQKDQSLYYKAIAGQTIFPLAVSDLFGHSATLVDETALAVTRNGARLTPDDGTGVGGYTFNPDTVTITLLWPAGDGEILIADIFIQPGDCVS